MCAIIDVKHYAQCLTLTDIFIRFVRHLLNKSLGYLQV